MSIRDIVRRERWEMNCRAHESELMLLGMTTTDMRDEGDSAWAMILTDYVNTLVAETRRRVNERLAGAS
jgi:hypothetical protein